MLSKKIKNEIKQNVLKRKDEESCGLLAFYDGHLHVIPCKNTSKNPRTSFTIDNETVQKYFKKYQILGFYHSHVDEDCKHSWIDRAMAETINKVSVVYSIKTNRFSHFEPRGWIAPLEKRPYMIGIFDSFSLFRDFYKKNIQINNNFSYYRYTKPISEISVNNKGILEKVLNKYNFFEIESPEDKSTVLFKKNGIGQDLGIYHQGLILTQLENNFSKYYKINELSDYELIYYGRKVSKD